MVFTLAIVLLLCGVLGDDQADKGPRVIWCQADMECRLAFWDPDVRCSQNRCTKQGKEVLQDGRKFFFFHLIILFKIIYIPELGTCPLQCNKNEECQPFYNTERFLYCNMRGTCECQTTVGAIGICAVPAHHSRCAK